MNAENQTPATNGLVISEECERDHQHLHVLIRAIEELAPGVIEEHKLERLLDPTLWVMRKSETSAEDPSVGMFTFRFEPDGVKSGISRTHLCVTIQNEVSKVSGMLLASTESDPGYRIGMHRLRTMSREWLKTQNEELIGFATW